MRALLFLLLWTVLFGTAVKAEPPTPAPTPPPGAAAMLAKEKPLTDGSVAPDFTAQDKDGKPVRLSDYKGKVVVLDFWATWCVPCQASLPHVDTMGRDLQKSGVVVLAVSVWDTADAFRQWLPRHPSLKSTAFVIDPSKGGWEIAHQYGLTGIPFEYVIGRDGRIVTHAIGDSPSGLDHIFRSAARASRR